MLCVCVPGVPKVTGRITKHSWIGQNFGHFFFFSFLFFANLKSNFPPITRFKGSTSLTSFFFSKSFYGSVKFHGSILVTRYVKVRG